MKTIRVVVPDNFNLFLFGDAHEGNRLFSERAFQVLQNTFDSDFLGVPARDNIAVDHGDACDAITVDDKRYHSGTNGIVDLDHQVKMSANRRRSFGRRLKVILKGNHEHSLVKSTNLIERICERIDVEYGTFSCVLEYVDSDGNIIFKHYAAHGAGSIRSNADDPVRSDANMKLMLKRKLKMMFGDTLLNTMGHTHKLIVCSPTPVLYLTLDEGKVKQNYTSPRKKIGYIEPNHKWYVNTGSFLKLYNEGDDGYVERFMLDPVELGFAVALIRDRELIEIKTVKYV